ncbi:hypothetical protein [Streptomyces sp. NPDC045470]|uniref:hypothetical protein n=1 Tax=Streptomyces sp. NPDC045470 TaxID=3155469 RepID=UPI0033C1267D
MSRTMHRDQAEFYRTLVVAEYPPAPNSVLPERHQGWTEEWAYGPFTTLAAAKAARTRAVQRALWLAKCWDTDPPTVSGSVEHTVAHWSPAEGAER